MKKLLLLALLVSTLSFATITHNEVKSGEYKGYQKLEGFTDSDKFDVFVKVSRKGRAVSTDTKIKPNYKKVNLKEKLSINYKGKTITHSRKEWYDLITNTSGNSEFALSVVEKNFPEIFKDYEDNNIFANESEINTYVREVLEVNAPEVKEDLSNQEDSFCKDPNIAAKDKRLCVVSSEQDHLEKMSQPAEIKDKKQNKLDKAVNFLQNVFSF